MSGVFVDCNVGAQDIHEFFVASPAAAGTYETPVGAALPNEACGPRLVGEIFLDVFRLAPVRERFPHIESSTGLVVSPGFIDMHSHSDASLLADGRALSKVYQGVTTELLGESGSAGPVPPSIREDQKSALAELGLTLDWTTLGEYFDRLKRQGTSVNVLSSVGSGSLRAAVVGYDNRPATPEELQEMRRLMAEAMEDGAVGLSSGLIYVPNRYAPTEELVELAKVAARYGGSYATHLRDEADYLERGVDEAIRIGRDAKVPVHIFHFKFSSVRSQRIQSTSPVRGAVDTIEQAREYGIEIFCDVYPYNASQTTLNMLLPDWSHEGGSAALATRLRSADSRRKIHDEVAERLEKGIPGASPETVLLARTPFEDHRRFQGKTLGVVSEEMGVSPTDAILELVEKADGRASGIFFGIREGDLEYALGRSWTSIGSDGAALSPSGVLAQAHTHPRAYGTFPRVLARFVRERGTLTLPEALHKMTGLPASQLRLSDRGQIRIGAKADIVVFDPDTIEDVATFDAPHRLSTGVHWLLVNGEIVLEDGEHTGALPGRVLRWQKPVS